MSSILKALRKIEEEKRVDKQAAPDLMSDQGIAPAKSKSLLFMLSGVVLGAAIVGLLFLLAPRESAPVVKTQPVSQPAEAVTAVPKFQEATKAVPEQQAVKAVPGEQTIEPTASLDAAGRNLRSLAEAGRVEVVSLAPEPVKAAVIDHNKPLKPATKPPSNKTPLDETAVVAGSPAAVTQPAQQAMAVNAKPGKTSELPDGLSLLVSEIFYQEDSANRMAVVNDLPVMVGTTVDSAVVAEIFPDSVLFEIGGMTYLVDQSRP